MLGHFPTPHPDELLYSIFARFSTRLCYPNKKSLLLEMFGTENALAVVDLPSHLGGLIQKMPHNDYYSVQSLIDKHTLLPYYSPFLNASIVNRLRRQMKGSEGSSIHRRAGVMASRVRPPQWLRYCLKCAVEDRRLVGETYWHRLHQTPGVEVCHKHFVFLSDSTIRIHNAQTRHVFFSGHGIDESAQPRVLDQSDPDHCTLLTLSRNSAWLLDHPDKESEFASVRPRYLKLLADRGLATYRGSIHAEALLVAFGEKYPQSLLSQLTSLSDDYASSRPSWIFDLIRSTRHTKHPLQHLLLMGLLEQIPADVVYKHAQFQLFTEGPYPCLNRAASHFREKRISRCVITFTKDHGKPVATFQCDCGFTYSRSGPDKGESDQLRVDRMVQFGEVWTNALRKMWDDPDISLRLLARRLGVDPLTVKRQATLASLAFPRRARRSDLMRPPRMSSSHTREPLTKKIEIYKETWLSLRTSNPVAGTTQLRRLGSSTYTWLRRNDPEWLKSNLPKARLRPPAVARVDWKERDQQLARAAMTASLRLRSIPGKPVRISVARIARAVGQLALIQGHLDRLPETARVLASALDTRESFAIRRINYVVELYTLEGIAPRRWQFVRRSGLTPSIEVSVAVQDALEAAMDTLEQ